jgi:hypothetical protein
LNDDKVKILKFVDESKDATNNTHIEKRFPRIDILKETGELINDGYMKKHPTQFGYQLTAAGRNILDVSARNRNEMIRYSVTTAIAVAAFIRSFFS